MSYTQRRLVPSLGFAGAGTGSRAPHGFLGLPPTSTVRRYKGPMDTLKMMADHALGDQGERSMIVRQFVEWVTRDVCPKDYLSEIIAIRNCFVQPSPSRPWAPLFKYTNDPLHVEMVKTPERMVKEIMQNGSTVVDCDDTSCMAATMCLQIGRAVELVAMGFSPGQLSHVAIRAKEPKTGKQVLLDGVAGPREKEAAGRAKEIFFRSLD